MRVVYDAALFPGAGGGPRHFDGLARALGRTDCELDLVVPSCAPVELSTLPGRVWAVACPSEHRVARQLQYEVRRLILILRWFVTGRRFDVWMARHAVLGVTLPAARLVAKQVVLEVNGPVREEMRANFGSRAAMVGGLIFRVQLLAATTALAVTPGLAGYVGRMRPHRRAVVLPNGADRPVGPEPSGPREGLVFAGALAPWYAVDVVVEAVGLLRGRGRHVTLEVLGDGVERPKLERRVADLGLADRVRIRGWVEPDEVYAALHSASVGVLPLVEKSPTLDVVGSPLKLYEYAAAGLHVVGTDIDGVRDTPVSEVVHVYDARDAQVCADAIEAALGAVDEPLGADRWSWDARARELIDELAGFSPS